MITVCEKHGRGWGCPQCIDDVRNAALEEVAQEIM